jgi:hypothetical protein
VSPVLKSGFNRANIIRDPEHFPSNHRHQNRHRTINLQVSTRIYAYLFIYLFYSSLLPFGSLLPLWSIGLIFQFLDHAQTVGLLRRVISSSQGLYLNTIQHKHRKTHTHIKHPCSEWDSNQRSRSPSEQRQCMPQTARPPRPEFINLFLVNLIMVSIRQTTYRRLVIMNYIFVECGRKKSLTS